MLAGRIVGKGDIRLVDIEAPRLADESKDRIIFQPEITCLCGSDLPFFVEDQRPTRSPTVCLSTRWSAR